MENNNNIELRNNEVRDILKKMPHWTIRWGITIILVSVLLLLLFSYMYRYPDLIESEVVVSAINPPAEIKARQTGKTSGLLVDDGEMVEAGFVLAVIENPAVLKDIEQLNEVWLDLDAYIDSFENGNMVNAPNDLVLGEVNESYSVMLKYIDEYQNFISQDLYVERENALKGQIEMQQQMLKRLSVQSNLEEERFEIVKKSYRRDSQLFAQNIISMEDYESAKSNWISSFMNLEAVKKEWVSTKSGIFELIQQKANLNLEYENEKEAFRSNISIAYKNVDASIRDWYHKYVLISPIDGIVSFNKVWSENQNITVGETVFTIVPDKPVGLLGKAYVLSQGAGKVKVGQRVNIKLNNYPYMEYGMLIGHVKRKAPVPVDNLYAIEIELSKGLTTNYNNDLEMQQELEGKCEIITGDLRLLQRVVYPIKALIERNKR